MEIWIALGGLIIAGGGLALTGLTLTLNYRERTAAYRSHLFQRQMSRHEEIATAAGTLYDLALELAVEPDEASRATQLEPLITATNSFVRTTFEQMLLIDQDVGRAYDDFTRAVLTVAKNAANAPDQQPPKDELSAAFLHAINGSRAILGIGPLTRETLRTIAALPTADNKARRRALARTLPKK